MTVESFVVDYNAPKTERVFDYGTADAYPEQLYDFSGIASGVHGFDNVTEAHLQQFHEQGCLIVHDAFSPTEVQDALDGLAYLISGQNPDFTGLMYERKAQGVDVDALPPEERQDYIRKFMWFVEHEARLKALAYHPQLQNIVQRLMNDAPVLFQDMALIKPPRIGREKPWHQDHAYFDLPLTTTIVGVWIALDEATTANGCMVVYPGSHRQGPVVHFQRRDWQICDDQERQQVLAVPLKPGGCLFFHSLIHHGTPANNSSSRRRAVQFHYQPQSTVKSTKEERLAIFGADGKDVTC